MSSGKSILQRLWIVLACISSAALVGREAKVANSSRAADANQEKTSLGISFVRKFSSAKDVRRPHQVLNETIDIIAGPEDGGSRVTTLQSPTAVTTGSQNRVFVADTGAKAVHIFDFYHSKYTTVGNRGEGLIGPVSLATDAHDNLYVADQSSGRVLVYDTAGKFQRDLGKVRGGESYFESPTGIAIDPANGYIYICDARRHLVIVMNDGGGVVGKFGRRGGGDGPGEFRTPNRIAVHDREVFVLDSATARIQILDTAGNLRRAINLVYADRNTGLAVDRHGSIYVSDPSLNRIQVFTHEGRPQYTFDPSSIKGANDVRQGSGIWIDSSDCLYVTDAQSPRIAVFQLPQPNGRQCL